MLFETGYGPSGLPHIGTFGEVARTSWVRHAYTVLTGQPSRLLAFSRRHGRAAQGAGQRAGPGHAARLSGRPLTRMPDPFGTHESFGHHNNAMLRGFLDRFGFEYEFAPPPTTTREGGSTRRCGACWRPSTRSSAVILPTLGPERRATYSPILPIHPRTGVVEQVRIDRVDPTRPPCSGPMRRASGSRPRVLGGAAKCQWKADWAMRWFALGVDYEMSGKDLIDSVKLSGRICRVLGRPAADRLHLRAVPGRARPEDQQEQGQRALAWRSGCVTRRPRA